MEDPDPLKNFRIILTTGCSVLFCMVIQHLELAMTYLALILITIVLIEMKMKGKF